MLYRIKEISQSKIILIIDGSLGKNIIGNRFNILPNEVSINGTLETTCIKTCNLNDDIYEIILTFYDLIGTCKSMFNRLSNILEIDLSNFDASNVTCMDFMFEGCRRLKKINFGNINTSSVQSMSRLFYYCQELTSIDLSKFDTSSVKIFGLMFCYCEKIKTLDISNFNTSNAEDFLLMFDSCSELVTVNLSSFDTSKVYNMESMFNNCKNLKYLDLRNFEATSLKTIDEMFVNCNSLIYLNLFSLKFNETLNVTIHGDIFSGVPSYFKYCINVPFTAKDILIKSNNTKINNCSDICFQKDIKIYRNICVYECNEELVEYNNICYRECPFGTYKVYNYRYICIDKITEDYFLDTNDNIYKKCHQNCKYCIIEGINHNCTKCEDGFIFLNDPSAQNNTCYKNCTYYYYFDEENNYFCTENNSCPENYIPIEGKNKCIYDNKTTTYITFPEVEIVSTENKLFSTEYKLFSTEFQFISSVNQIDSEEKDLDQDEFFKYIQSILKQKLNSSDNNNYEDSIYIKGKVTYTLTSTINQRESILKKKQLNIN